MVRQRQLLVHDSKSITTRTIAGTMPSRKKDSSAPGGRSSSSNHHRPLPMPSNHWVEGPSTIEVNPAPGSSSASSPSPAMPFTSSFPAAPRRQPPILNEASFSDYDTVCTFREPGSTARALASLQQSKYERMERRRALSLLGLLLAMALVMHGSSTGMLDITSLALKGGRDGNNASMKGKNQDRGFREVSLKNVRVDIDEAYAEEGGKSSRVDDIGEGGKENERESVEEPKSQADIEKEEKEAAERDFFNQLEMLGDFDTPKEDTDIPFFWHVPRSAGSTMKDIMGQCLGLTSASEVGVRDGHQYDQDLQIVEHKGVQYINVDTTSLSGLDRAKELGLASSGVVDVVVSSYLFQAAAIFEKEHQGRIFAIFRDPVERAVSMYNYVKSENSALSDLSLADYARGNGIENNWMVRYLVNQMEGELDRSALDRAKEVLERKFLVGLITEKEESVARFQKYMEWADKESENAETKQDCISGLLKDGVNQSPSYDLPKKGSQEWALISHQTQYDIKLFDYAKDLFKEQTKRWGTKEFKKAEKKKKKGGN